MTTSDEPSVTGSSFWDHLDALRSTIVRMLVAVLAAACVCFCFKEWMFSLLLAPSQPDFPAYRLLAFFSESAQSFHVDLFNPQLTQQFVVHIKASFAFGVLLVSPYLVFSLFHFIAPALYTAERRPTVRAATGGFVMFLAGVVLSYFLIFPLTFRFLGTYQVDPTIPNIIALDDYMSLLFAVSMLMGILFELPILAWLLAKVRLIQAHTMRHFRRHAIVAILIIAAIITPTGDPFTLTIVALPIYLLYEFSIFIVNRTTDHLR